MIEQQAHTDNDAATLELERIQHIPGELPADAVVVVILGGPGSGKGTVCARLAEKYGMFHISSGELLRAEVASGSKLGDACSSLMSQGKLLPPKAGCTMIQNAMLKSNSCRFLLDGFPRSVDQANTFESLVTKISLCIFLDCPEDVMRQRLLSRGQATGRADDQDADTVRKRFATFRADTLPVPTMMAAQGTRVHRIAAEGTKEEVMKSAEAAVSPILPNKAAGSS